MAIWLSVRTVNAVTGDDPAGLEFFEKKIRPTLADNCYQCHSRQSEKLKGGLLLDTREGLLKGGETGPAIEPGDPDHSLLIKAVRYTDEKLQMPPKGKKLSPEQIADLETWLKMGAPDPRNSPSGAVSRAESIKLKARRIGRFSRSASPAFHPSKTNALSARRWTISSSPDWRPKG